MQGFGMLIYGTGDQLYDAENGTWVTGSQGFIDSLAFIQTLYGEGLAPSPDVALDANMWQTLYGTWFPEGKIGANVDGSWGPSFRKDGGLYEWKGYADDVLVAPFPTQDGSGPGAVSLSGGWTLALSSQSMHPQEAFEFLALALNKENQLAYNDAWDIDEHYRRHVTELCEAVAVEEVPHERDAIVRVVREFGSSRVVQTLTLTPEGDALDIETTVDWHERQKLLKLAFPLDVHTDHAASEIQFGHVHRATHGNTSWDMARFETVAHRWVHVGETGFGVAVANDASYGHDITRAPRAGGGTTTTVRVSLLRAPLYPDSEADQGQHVFRVSVRPGAAIADAVREGYRLNLPVRAFQGGAPVEPLVVSGNDAVVVEAVKLAEDRSGDVVVRLYEAHGGRASASLTTAFDFAAVAETDLLEREGEPHALVAATGRAVELALRPFQLVTLRFRAPRM